MKLNKLNKLSAGLLMAGMLLFNGCSVISPGDRGVRLVSGEAQSEVLQPGMHGYFPVLYSLVKMNVQIQKSEVKTSASSKDLQEITTVFALNWSIAPESVVDVLQLPQLSLPQMSCSV